jgi:hypothetical protein
MRTFRQDNAEMSVFAKTVVDHANNPEYQLKCDPGNERSVKGIISQLFDVTIQQKPISQLLHCGYPPAPTFHFRFQLGRRNGKVLMNWDKVETTVYHLDGKSGMFLGEIDDLLKEFLSVHILAEINQPSRRTRQRAAELST